jgi:hypothetical protein
MYGFGLLPGRGKVYLREISGAEENPIKIDFFPSVLTTRIFQDIIANDYQLQGKKHAEQRDCF